MQRLRPTDEFALVSLVLSEPISFDDRATPTEESQSTKVVEHSATPSARHFDSLFPQLRVSVRQVGDDPERTVLHLDLDVHVVLWKTLGRWEPCRAYRTGLRSRQPADQVDEVTRLADDPAPSDRRVLEPVIGWQRARVDPVMDHEGIFNWIEEGFEL